MPKTPTPKKSAATKSHQPSASLAAPTITITKSSSPVSIRAKPSRKRGRSLSSDTDLTDQGEDAMNWEGKEKSGRVRKRLKTENGANLGNGTRTPSEAPPSRRSARGGTTFSLSGGSITKAASLPNLFSNLGSTLNPLPTSHLPPSLAQQPKSNKPIAPVERSVFVFGSGEMGQFGLGTSNSALVKLGTPKIHPWFESQLDVKNGVRVWKIATGGMHTAAIDETGKVWTWGINDDGALGRSTEPANDLTTEDLETRPLPLDDLYSKMAVRAVQVVAGESFTAALGVDGSVWAWGTFKCSDGNLGLIPEKLEQTQSVPFKLAHLPTSTSSDPISSLHTGHSHLLALTVQGRIYTLGNGQQAQLGRRIIERRKGAGLVPERLGLKNIVAVGGGDYHCFAVEKNGAVWGWGLNNYGQVGVRWSEYGVDSAQHPHSPVKSRTSHAHDDDEDGIVWNPTIIPQLLPSALGSNRRVVSVTGGEHHSLFLLSDGSVMGCGRMDGHELGITEDHPEWKILQQTIEVEKQKELRRRKRNGSADNEKIFVDEYIPYPIVIPLPTKVKQLASAVHFNHALDEQGQLYSWGYGRNCELGLGKGVAGSEAKVPTKVVLPTRRAEDPDSDAGDDGRWVVESVHCGGHHCLLLGSWIDAQD